MVFGWKPKRSVKARSRVVSKKGRHALLEAKSGVRQRQADGRDRVCIAPKYPGKPSDYTYVLSEYCVSKVRGKKGIRASRRSSTLSNERELAVLKSALAHYPDDYDEHYISASTARMLLASFKMMINPENRINYSDPLVRYNHIRDKLFDNYNQLKTDSDVAIRKADFPRYSILKLVEYHLESE
jgi:hypothetical protein